MSRSAASCLKAASLSTRSKSSDMEAAKRLRIIGFQIGRLISDERITGRMALVKPVTGEFIDLIKNLTCFFLSTLLATAPSMKRAFWAAISALIFLPMAA